MMGVAARTVIKRTQTANVDSKEEFASPFYAKTNDKIHSLQVIVYRRAKTPNVSPSKRLPHHLGALNLVKLASGAQNMSSLFCGNRRTF